MKPQRASEMNLNESGCIGALRSFDEERKKKKMSNQDGMGGCRIDGGQEGGGGLRTVLGHASGPLSLIGGDDSRDGDIGWQQRH
jgi:hypothetical protein